MFENHFVNLTLDLTASYVVDVYLYIYFYCIILLLECTAFLQRMFPLGRASQLIYF